MTKRPGHNLQLYKAHERMRNKPNLSLARAAQNKGLDYEEAYEIDTGDAYLFFDLSFTYKGMLFLVDIERVYQASGSFKAQKPTVEAKKAWAAAHNLTYSIVPKWLKGGKPSVVYGVMLEQMLMKYRSEYGLAKSYTPNVVSVPTPNGNENDDMIG